MEKRGQRRVRRRFPVRFGPDGPTSRGFTRDISATGAFVVCGQLPPVGTHLKLEIQLGADQRVLALGVVRRTRHVPVALRHVEPMGFGVSFQGNLPVDLEARAGSRPEANRRAR